ncbi:hypothetical protein D3C81_1803710 [compost metagenome]
MFGGIGSAAISAVPVRAKTRSISGNFAFKVDSICCCISTDWERLVPGIRSAWIARSPSLRLGTNSLPSLDAIARHSAIATQAMVRTTGVFVSDFSSNGS